MPSCTLPVFPSGVLLRRVCVHHTGRVDECGADVHRDRNAECLCDFFCRGALFDCSRGVEVMQPSHWRVTATASAINSRIVPPSTSLFSPRGAQLAVATHRAGPEAQHPRDAFAVASGTLPARALSASDSRVSYQVPVVPAPRRQCAAHARGSDRRGIDRRPAVDRHAALRSDLRSTRLSA